MEQRGQKIYAVLLVIIAGILLGYLYRLKLPFAVAVIAVEAVLIPIWMKARKRQAMEQKRFADVNLYMEQVLYSFRKSPQILSALMDVGKLFPTGNMSECIQRAITLIRETYQGERIVEKSLETIEMEYPASRLSHVHRLMLKAEQLGGNCEGSIRILLKDRDIWEKETISYQKRCQVQKRNITVAIILSCLLCLMTPILCQSSLKRFNVTGNLVYQTSTVILLISSLLIYLYTEKYFTRDWLQKKSAQDDNRSLEKYEKVVHYNFAKAKKKSLLWALAVGVFTAIFAVMDHWFVAAACCPCMIVCLFQHRIDYALARKAVIHEIRKAFPDWLMEVALLLQTENVANSIRKSMESAPEILKPQLKVLMEKLEQNPESNLPYSEFLAEFSIPEVASAMGMLYSISDGGGSDAGVQMEEILERNAEWMGQSEALANQDKVAKMYVLFLLPALLGALKMVLDMTLILLAFFSGGVQ